MRAREHRLGLAAFAFVLLAAACSGSEGRADVGILDPGRRDGMATDTAGLDWGGAEGSSDASTDPDPDAVVEADAPPVDLICDDDSDCPAALPYCDAITRLCIECVSDLSCGPDRACQAGRCVDRPCTPDLKKCAGSVKKVCNHLGTGWASEDCAPKECAGGECVGCTPGAVRCSGDSVEECTGSGFWAFSVECPGLCYEGACHACMPGKLACDQGAKGTLVVRCDESGETTSVVEDCNPNETGNVCQSGACTSLCLDNLKLNTNIGCDYWAADLDQIDDGGADDSPYAVVVSNVNDTYAAKVTITRFEGGQEVPQLTDASGALFPTEPIPPRQLRIYFLPPRNVSLTTQDKLAWHVTSAIPVIAYQFNPLENVGVFSNDASLLIPSNALGKKYTVMSWPERVGGLRAYVAIVGVGPGPATVTLTPTAPTLAGTIAASGAAIPALAPGQAHTFVLEPFDVLQVQTDQANSDLTGSRVESDAPVAVFGGTQCSNVPDTRCVNGTCPGLGGSCSGECALTCCCDHMEEQLLPLSAWGKSYVGPMLWLRHQEVAFWRIVASEPDTHVTLDPPEVGVPTLQANEVFEFQSRKDLSIKADRPILVGQFMASSFLSAPCGSCEGAFLLFPGDCDNGLGDCLSDDDCCEHTGDPAFILMIPNEQFRADYVFLVPDKYAKDYVSIVAGTTTSVTLDGAPLAASGAAPAGASGYVVYRQAIADGVHTLTADKPVMAYVYGYDTDVSYGYPAGANVVAINPNGM